MPKGNKLAYKNFPLYDNGDTTKEENAILCQYALDVFNAKEPDLNNPKEVEETIQNYFINCTSKGLKPGNLGLYASLGLDKNNVRDLVQGRVKTVNGRSVNVGSVSLLKKAIKAIGSYREMLGAQGKISPPVLIFWQKNYDNLQDVQTIELDANNAPKADMSPEEIEQKMLEDMPVESEYKEIK